MKSVVKCASEVVVVFVALEAAAVGSRLSTAGQDAQPVALPERLWTHQETAAFLSIPVATLHQLNYKGTGPRSYKVGRHRRYDPLDIAAWLAKRSSDARAALILK